MVQSDRPQMTISYDACTLHAGSLGLQRHTNNTFFSTTTLLHYKYTVFLVFVHYLKNGTTFGKNKY
jgi:hypothetical protein